MVATHSPHLKLRRTVHESTTLKKNVDYTESPTGSVT